jgi:hypothetical protein
VLLGGLVNEASYHFGGWHTFTLNQRRDGLAITRQCAHTPKIVVSTLHMSEYIPPLMLLIALDLGLSRLYLLFERRPRRIGGTSFSLTSTL